MSVNHYENFPVASLLLPARLRPAVRNVYAFARGADDIADEGDATPKARIATLARWRNALQAISQHRALGQLDDDERVVFEALAATITEHQLPVQPFFDLLSAFTQDAQTGRYANESALLDYCSRSANPVGRIMLHLYREVDAPKIAQADALCTGLQRTNFCQDVAIDWLKGRLYLPQDRLAHHGVDESYIAQCVQDPPPHTSTCWQALMHEQVNASRRHLLMGRSLAYHLPGRIGFELRLVVQGGLAILDKITHIDYNVFAHRPVLGKADWFVLLWRALQPLKPSPTR
ncbi:squalene synthase HpnC [Alcaligenaceae bacterium CGII-47]|nr:squalene synthase HpnC [Alcaligenaceae bacterium CGII-47]